jgi:DnaJ-class molecular chaperone
VNDKSSKNDIKRAYRELSLKYHPDRNCGNTDFNSKFQQINEAYETLGDDQKREEYEQTRNNPFLKMSMGGGGMGAGGMGAGGLDDLLNNLFSAGMMGGLGGMGGGNNAFFSEGGFSMHPMHPGFVGSFGGGGGGGPNIRIFRTSSAGPSPAPALQKPTPVVKTITLNMEQVLNGGNVPVDIERWIIENDLKVFENETLYVPIPQGIDENEIIILKNKGNALTDECRGDVKLFIKVENNTDFERQGLDLLINKTISLKEALCGFSFELKYINGKTYTLNNTLGNIIPPNYKKVIMNMGLTREGRIGNLIIHFIVEFPEKMEVSQLEALNTIL